MTSPPTPPDALAAPAPADAVSVPRLPRQRWRVVVRVPASTEPGDGSSGTRAWVAVLAASGLPVAREGAGRGRAVLAAPLPLGIAGEREVADVYLAERRTIPDVRAALAAALPAEWSLVDLHDVWLGAPAAPASVTAADYRVVVAGAPRWALEGAVEALLASSSLPRERRREKRTTAFDLRPLLISLEVRGVVGGDVLLGMRLAHAQDAVGRPEDVLAALGERPAPPLDAPLVARQIVRERLVLTGDEGPAGA